MNYSKEVEYYYNNHRDYLFSCLQNLSINKRYKFKSQLEKDCILSLCNPKKTYVYNKDEIREIDALEGLRKYHKSKKTWILHFNNNKYNLKRK